MAMKYSGWKLFMTTLLGATFCTGGGWAAPNNKPAKGWLIKGEANVAPAYALQMTSFTATDGSDQEFSFEAPMFLLGPVVGVNVGYAPSRELRWGLRASAQVAFALDGGDGIPHTELDGQGRLTVGPTVGVRLGPRSPWELEFGVGFAAMFFAGSQLGIGAPDNGYPLGKEQYGVDGLARAIWRPWGARSPVGFQGGFDLGWAMVPDGRTSTHAFLVAPELGIVVGL
jgi:hypothetical protein